MALQYPPDRGEVLVCDFNGLLPHEMKKIRPCVVLSPRIRQRANLATVVCLSTSLPDSIEDYHEELNFDPPYSKRFSSPTMWVKGDMVYSISLARLTRPHIKSPEGKREYKPRILNETDFNTVLKCVLCGIGFKVDKNLNRL
jgi:mRNA interferase MazF